MDLDSVQDFLALQKTPDIKVNVYTPSNTAGKGKGGAVQCSPKRIVLETQRPCTVIRADLMCL